MTRLFALIGLLLPGVLFAEGMTVIPLSPETVNLVHAETRGQKLTADPAGGMRLELNEGIFAFGEVHCKKEVPLGDCREGEIQLEISLEDPEMLHSVSLRLRDGQGELFQFPSAGATFVKGENLLRFPFRDGLQRGSWGNPKIVNRKIDWPLNFSGFSIRLKKDGGIRRVRIGEVSFLPGGERKAVSTAPLFFFDDRSKFAVAGAETRLTPEGLLLAATSKNATLREYKLPMRAVSSPLRLVLSGEVRRGEGTIRLLGQDGGGKTLTSETPFREGQTEFTLEFPAGTDSAIVRQIEFRGKSAEFELLLAAAKLTRSVPAAEALLFDIETGNPLHILREGEEEKLRLALTNSSEQPLAGNAEFTFIDFFGNRKTETAAFSLAPGETLRHRPATAVDRFGIVTVEAKLTETGSKSAAFRQLAFARLRPAGPTPLAETGEFLFGVCTHTTRWALRDQELEAEAAALAGAKIVRGALPEWSSIQPEPDRWNFAEYDRLLELFRSRGVGVQGKFYFTPRWAAPPEVRDARDWRDWNRAAPELAAWRTFVRTMAARYRGKVNYWETWNEPDLYSFARFGVESYIELQKAAFEEIRKVAPEAKVMTAGFATLRPFGRKERDNARYIREALSGARGFYDLVAYHEHGAFPIYVRSVDDLLLPAMREAGASGWYSNETGISSAGGQEPFQAEMVYKKMLFAWSRGAAAYNWYDLRNDGFAPYNGEHNYGMMTADFYPKPALAAYAALTRTYRNAHFLKQLPAAPGVWLLLFRQDGNLLLTGWDENAQAAGVPLLIASDARSAERIDLMGNAAPAAQSESMTLFPLDRVPATLRLNRAAKAENAGPLFTVAAPDAVAPGQEFPVRVEFANSFGREIGGELELRGGRSCSPEQQVRKFRVPPGGRTAMEFRMKSAAGMPAGFGSRIAVPLAWRFSGVDCTGTSELTFQSAIPVSGAPFDGRRPDFRLNRKEQVFSFQEAQPDMAHRLWKGVDDLSAEVWIGISGETLKLRALVRDDVHCQPESGRQLWKGDGIQFALAFPGQEGMWELGLARQDNGKSDAFGWQGPTGFDPEKAARQIRLVTARDRGVTRYDAEIPLDALGVKAEATVGGFRFNLLVNENDGEGRDGWIEIAPGLGSGKNPARYPALVTIP